MPFIELQHLSYYYPDGQPALDRIDLSLEQGNCYVLSGPNGCGKSTLFRILNGLSFPTEGRYLLNGTPITEKYMRDKKSAGALHRQIGYLFQNSEAQLFTRSVEDEIAFGLYQLGLPEEEVHARTERYLQQLSLESMRSRAPYNLSGGEKKRCALAAVLAMEPAALIMDEPLSGLDEEGQQWITDCIASLKGAERLILIATHNSEMADHLADIRLRMDKEHHLSVL